eukprot:TRINITY_DN67549_c12_g1_i1.p2 TRINITY_DN67549_c12_g1~~TRINITY_DN67549_c12_g1_i1.p2  ORF type:complete len:642 (+),score=400.22 TRINITY_DN67549_c12_g1_i1:28-1926(+)
MDEDTLRRLEAIDTLVRRRIGGNRPIPAQLLVVMRQLARDPHTQGGLQQLMQLTANHARPQRGGVAGNDPVLAAAASAAGGGRLGGADPLSLSPVLSTLPQRAYWEQVFASWIDPVLKQDELAERVEAAYAKYSTSDEDEASVFVAEMLEQYDVTTMDRALRLATAPALWVYRRPFSLPEFRMELNLAPKAVRAFPLLHSFLEEEPRLRGLRHMSAMIEWISLLLGRFNNRIDHATASKTTVAEVIRESPDPMRWMSAFHGFRQAWNTSWQFVERFGCMEIPALYKRVEMEPATPISFCLPGEKDEGICPLTLARFLGQQHNRFVEKVDEILLMRGEELQRSASRQGVVSSKFFTNAHSLSYRLEAFAEFVEKQCTQHSASGSVAYDFKSAEQYLLDTVFMGKPLIDLEVRMMQYTNAQSGGSVTALLRQKVRQEPLNKDACDQILKELASPSVARHVMELLETTISFLQATGGAFVQRLDIGDKPLGEYVQTVLLMDSKEFVSRTLLKEVCLKHIDALWRLLRDFTVVDPFTHVRTKYKAPLDEKQAELLQESVDALKLDVLVPLLKEFICSQLTEDHMGDDADVKGTVGYIDLPDGDAYLMDLDWFDAFPDGLQMKNVLAVYKLLEEAHK